MTTSPLTPDILASSVIAVPPLARKANYAIDSEQNRTIIRHIEAGGVSTLLYGGNANLYHVRLSEYESLLRMLQEEAGDNTTVIPSIGPSVGMMAAQVKIARDFDFPTLMVLPTRDAITSSGIATGMRHAVEAYGKPVVLYIKHDQGLTPSDCIRLVSDGLIVAIKYAIVRENPVHDDYLRALLEGVDANIVISGIGEQPAIIHMRDFGLAGFTSGCVCVAPALSQHMLDALNNKDYALAEEIRRLFSPLEDLRNTYHPVRVLHEAVRLADIANTGPAFPLLSNLEDEHHAAVQEASLELMQHEQAILK